jgi:hypothetical protein
MNASMISDLRYCQLPRLPGSFRIVVSICPHKLVYKVAANGSRPQQLREFGKPQQPVRVPGRLVGIVAVGYPINDVVRLSGLVEKLGYLGRFIH